MCLVGTSEMCFLAVAEYDSQIVIWRRKLWQRRNKRRERSIRCEEGLSFWLYWDFYNAYGAILINCNGLYGYALKGMKVIVSLKLSLLHLKFSKNLPLASLKYSKRIIINLLEHYNIYLSITLFFFVDTCLWKKLK